jgi:hypothetical protein
MCPPLVFSPQRVIMRCYERAWEDPVVNLECPSRLQAIYIDIPSCITNQYWYYFLESRHSHAFVSSFQPQPLSTSVCTSAACTCVDWDLTRLLRGDVLK